MDPCTTNPGSPLCTQCNNCNVRGATAYSSALTAWRVANVPIHRRCIVHPLAFSNHVGHMRQACNTALLRYNVNVRIWSGLFALCCMLYLGALVGTYRVSIQAVHALSSFVERIRNNYFLAAAI